MGFTSTLSPETLKSLREYYRVGLTYTSNAIEGNSLTESETKVVIENADLLMAGKFEELRQLLRKNDTVNDTVNAGSFNLSKTEQTVLEALRIFPTYSYENLAVHCHLSRPTIARTIKTLQRHELIRRIGSDKSGHWDVLAN